MSSKSMRITGHKEGCKESARSKENKRKQMLGNALLEKLGKTAEKEFQRRRWKGGRIKYVNGRDAVMPMGGTVEGGGKHRQRVCLLDHLNREK